MNSIETLRLCYGLAAKSGDLSTKNGAMIVDIDSGELLGYGNNDIPHHCEDTPERRERPLKYQFTEHAERAAIFFAAKEGNSTDGQLCFAAGPRVLIVPVRLS